jgi:hypothetical protein
VRGSGLGTWGIENVSAEGFLVEGNFCMLSLSANRMPVGSGASPGCSVGSAERAPVKGPAAGAAGERGGSGCVTSASAEVERSFSSISGTSSSNPSSISIPLVAASASADAAAAAGASAIAPNSASIVAGAGDPVSPAGQYSSVSSTCASAGSDADIAS